MPHRNAIPIEQLTPICHRYAVRRLELFGSYARGDVRSDSDIDLLVEFEPDARVGFLTLSALARELSAALGRQVDLVPKTGLKSRIRDSILAEAEVLFAA